MSRDHIEHVSLCIEVLFSLSWQDVPDRPKQASVITPIDPTERRHFRVLHVAPRPLAMDQPSFVEAVYRLREGVVIGVSHAADRRLDASPSQTFRVVNGQLLPARCPVGHCATMSRKGRSEW